MISYLFHIETVFALGRVTWLKASMENAWPFELDTKAAQCSFVALIIKY